MSEANGDRSERPLRVSLRLASYSPFTSTYIALRLSYITYLAFIKKSNAENYIPHFSIEENPFR